MALHHKYNIIWCFLFIALATAGAIIGFSQGYNQ